MKSNGRMLIELTPNNKSVYIELDKESCEFLIEELKNMLDKKEKFIEYDSETGYDCEILQKGSLGFIIHMSDKP
ncbi:MAG: hypothetical protein HFE48_02910 [Clostridia bacterium]|nr:hypothetical protein [Clostridia bacterium]